MENEEENLVVDTTENVEEPTTEEMVEGVENNETTEENQVDEKVYTEKEFNQKLDDLLAKKLARKEAKIRKEYDEKYSKAENILKTGLGVDNFEEATNQLEKFYTEQGVKITQPTYSDRELDILANAEAQDIINAGLDEVVEEVDRLTKKGYDNMSKKEKIIFQKLATTRQYEESKKELAKIGVKEDILNNDKFKQFSDMFDKSKVKMSDVYDMYSRIQPKKEVSQMGSMKGNTNKDDEVKDFYSYEESLKFTKADFDKNPKLYKAVCDSMSKW